MSHARSWARFSFFAPLVILSLSYPAHAAGSYTQSFDSNPPPDWVMAEDTWTATNGYYANATTQPFRAIAYFGDRRWVSDFTYSLRMYSDLKGTGNHKVGVVFNYVDEQNYFEVTISMVGDVQDNVELNQVVSGTHTLLATGRSAIPVIDQWFDVALVRSGNNNVRVRIGNTDVLNYDQLASPPVGYIGVLSQFNWGRFDDVKVTPVVFQSGFGAGLGVTQPVCVGPTGGVQKWQVDLVGTETATGTVWPPTFWGQPTVVAMNTILDCPDTPFTNFLDVRIKNAVHGNLSTRVISNTVKNVTEQPDGTIGRLGLSYTPGAEGDVPYRFYVRRYLKYSSNLATPGNGMWFVQQEFKNTSCDPPRRLSVTWNTDSNGAPNYRLRMDTGNSMSECVPPGSAQEVAPDFPERRCYPNQAGANCPQFITGQWFYDEYFVQYSIGGTPQDRVAYAINGQVIFDVPGPIKSAKARGIKLTPGYLNVPNVEIQADDLEVYHDFPCRTFPCGAPSHH